MTCVQSLACNMSQTPKQENIVLFLHHIFDKNNSAVQLDGELGAFFLGAKVMWDLLFGRHG